MRRRRMILTLLACGLTVAPPAHAVIGPVGNEFQAHTYYTGTQREPAVSSTRDGRFVVVWASKDEDGDSYGIFGQRFDARGNRRGGEFQVNVYTTNIQNFPSVATSEDGSFIVSWVSYGQDGDSGGIFSRAFSPLGQPLTSEVQVNTYTTFGQSAPNVARIGTGFIVVWRGVTNVLAQRLDFNGARVGTEFAIDTYSLTDKFLPVASAAADGSFVVSWASNNQGGDIREIFARRFDASANPLTPEIAVNTYTTGAQTNGSVASAPDGHFVVTWSSDGQDGSDYGVFGRRFDAAGSALGPEFALANYTTSVQRATGVGMAENGTFVVTWDSDGGDASNYSVSGRRYEAANVPVTPEFVVNDSTGGSQRFSAASAAANGRVAVVWESDQDADFSTGIYGKRLLAPDLVLADTFESGTLSAWSSASTDGGDLSVGAAAALDGTGQGLRAVVNDTNSLFVRDDTPAAETHYRARFWLDPNGFDPGEASAHQRVRVLLAHDLQDRRVVTLVLKRRTGQFSVGARVRTNSGARVDTPFVPITDAPHAIEIDWDRAGSVETADGTFELFVDGVSVATLSGLDDGGSAIEYVRLGVFSVKSGAAGTLFFDEFVSHRRTPIGP